MEWQMFGLSKCFTYVGAYARCARGCGRAREKGSHGQSNPNVFIIVGSLSAKQLILP